MSRLGTTASADERGTASAGRLLLGGLVALAVAQGIGRFFYTPLLPIMQAEYGLDSASAGLLASANFAGYLAGSVAAFLLRPGRARIAALRIGIVGSAVTTAVMGLSDSYAAWLVLRTLGGFASAFVMIAAAGIVAEALARVGEPARVGWVFGGVGLGMAVSGIIVRIAGGALDSSGLWLVAGALSGLAVPLILVELRDRQLPARRAVANRQRRVPRPLALGPLLVSYTCEGLGYSVFGTFIVAIVKARPGGEVLGDWVWVIAGLAGLPSCLLWMRFAEKAGFSLALMIAFAAQIIGLLLPAVSASGIAAIAAAVLFGATFIAITALTLPLGRHGAGGRGFAILTAGFGLGQMIGPGLAGYIVDFAPQYGFSAALIGSAGVLLIGLLFLAYAVATRPSST